MVRPAMKFRLEYWEVDEKMEKSSGVAAVGGYKRGVEWQD